MKILQSLESAHDIPSLYGERKFDLKSTSLKMKIDLEEVSLSVMSRLALS